jgi:hypothetical protein
MSHWLIGSLAGLTATVPMTAVMEVLHRQLPADERYPLPPRQVTMRLAEEAGVEDHLDESERTGLTLLNHFGYGAATGALYGLLPRVNAVPPVVGGIAYGLAVWAGSYLGLLPALGILSPATRHPARRNALMIAAHVVWGAVLATIVEQTEPRRNGGG